MVQEKIISKYDIEFISPAEKDGVRYTDKPWIKGVVVLTNQRIILGEESNKSIIPFKSIRDLGRPITGWRLANFNSGILAIDHDNEEHSLMSLIACSRSKYDSLKLQIMRLTIGMVKVMILSPLSSKQITQKDETWVKGILMVTDKDILLMDEKRNKIAISGKDIIVLDKNLKELGMDINLKNKPSLTIDHFKGDEQITTALICPGNILEMLKVYLSSFLKHEEPIIELPDKESKIVGLLFKNELDTIEIENRLGYAPQEVDRAYDELLSLDLAEVVLVRRELRLTKKGMRHVVQHMNNSL